MTGARVKNHDDRLPIHRRIHKNRPGTFIRDKPHTSAPLEMILSSHIVGGETHNRSEKQQHSEVFCSHLCLSYEKETVNRSMSNSDKQPKDDPRVSDVECSNMSCSLQRSVSTQPAPLASPHPASPQYPWSSRKYSSSHVCIMVLKNIQTIVQCPSFWNRRLVVSTRPRTMRNRIRATPFDSR